MKTSPCPPFLTSTRKLSATVIAQALFFLTAPLSAQVLYDFNTPGQLTNDFYPGSTQGGLGTQAVSGGLSDSGWVPNGVGARGWAVTNATFSPLIPSFTQSIYFKFGTTVATTGEALWIGIGRSSDPDVTFDPLAGNNGAIGPESLQSFQVGVGPRGDQLVRIFGSSIIDGVNANFNQPASPTAALTEGNWYYLQVDYTLLPEEDGFNFTVELYNSNASGTVSGASLLSYTSSVVNANLTAGNVHSVIGARHAGTVGPLGIDNFYVSAIPEASTLAMLAGVASLVALISIRRRLK